MGFQWGKKKKRRERKKHENDVKKIRRSAISRSRPPGRNVTERGLRVACGKEEELDRAHRETEREREREDEPYEKFNAYASVCVCVCVWVDARREKDRLRESLCEEGTVCG